MISDDCRDVLFVCLPFLYFAFFVDIIGFICFWAKEVDKLGTRTFLSRFTIWYQRIPQEVNQNIGRPVLIWIVSHGSSKTSARYFCDCLSGLGLSG